MANFDDFKPLPISRMGGQVDYQGNTKVLSGCAVLAQSVRYTPDTVGTRYGTLTTMAYQRADTQNADITGVDVLEVLGQINPGYRSIVFDSIGDLFIENPDGSGVLVPLSPPFPLPPAARMRTSTGDNSMLMIFEDGQDSVAPPIMYRGQTGQVMPVSQNPVGALWRQGTWYQVGDLVRAADGKWWRCTQAAIAESGPNPPLWPATYGYFNNASQWVAASATDSIGGSQWEEWTPACVQYLPPPNVAGYGVIRTANAGTLPAGKDIYVKVAYSAGNKITARSAAMVYNNTKAKDSLSFGTVINSAVAGSLPMPRWIAEMFMPFPADNPFTASSLLMSIFVASVPTGSAPPLDSAFGFIGASGATGPVRVSSLTTFPTNASTGCPVPNGPVTGGYNGINTTFMGSGGTRYMLVVRKDANASLSPVDPNSAILVNFVGEIQVAIIEIARDSSGNVTATVGDTTGFAVGQGIKVQGCTKDGSFDGNFTITNVQQTLDPQGILQWVDPANPGQSNDQTGAVVLPAGPVPTAFLPPGGLFDMQDIAAFTTASPADGSADNQEAGPFFYISAASPAKPFSTQILSMKGPETIYRTITSLQRFAGGRVDCILTDVTGITPGMTAIVQSQGDASFNGTYQIDSIVPGTGFGGTLVWLDTANSAAVGPTGGGLPVIVQQGTLGEVQAVVQDASGLSVGQDIQISNAPIDSFNGFFTIAKILGNVVTFPAAATGQALQFTGTQIQFVGAVTATFYPHATNFAGQCELRNPADGGNNPGSPQYPSQAVASGNSLMFNPAQLTGHVDPAVQPIQWATLDANGNIIGYTTPWSGARENYCMIVTALLMFPKAGQYAIHIEHDDGMYWGMGNGASRISGPQNCPNPSATLTAANGYPVMGANNVSGLNEDDYFINIPAPGFYPIEIDYAQWPTGQCLVVTTGLGGNIFGQYTAGPSVGSTGTMTLLQNLPTCAPAGTMNITSLQSDGAGNITATVDNLGGLTPGQVVRIKGPTFSTYFKGSGWVELLDAALNPDGLTGMITFKDADGTTGVTGTTGLSTKITNILFFGGFSSGPAVATVDSTVGFAVGQSILITGNNNPFFNGPWVISAIGANTITFIFPGHFTQEGDGGTLSLQTQSQNSPNSPGFVIANTSGWTVTGKPDILLNFNDTALTPDVDVTEQLATTGIYAASDVYFVPSLRVTAYVDNETYPASFVFSNEDDPGNIVTSSGDPNNPGSGIFVCQGADSSRAVCVREIKDGPIFALKRKGGWQINPSDSLPSQWNSIQRWKDYGPVCADLVAVGYNFIAFWDITKGPHVYVDGKLEWIGRELSNQGTLKRVNTSALTMGWAEVDEAEYELKFGIPLDGASVPNYELVVNFEGGWGFPEVINRFGKLIVPREARKWSINPWSARCAKSVKRVLNTQAVGLVPVPPSDPRINNRQFVYGMPGAALPADIPYQLFKVQRKNNVVTFYWQV